MSITQPEQNKKELLIQSIKDFFEAVDCRIESEIEDGYVVTVILPKRSWVFNLRTTGAGDTELDNKLSEIQKKMV